jgi:hypothetical protein
MAVPRLLVLGSLGLGVVGTLTATDLVSLREIAHAVDVPLLSGAVIMAREAMPSSVAHALEPLAAVLGLGALAVPGVLRVAATLNPSYSRGPAQPQLAAGL